MITNFNSSYMTMISLTYISCFSVKFSFNRFVPILNILRGKYYHKIFCSETWDEMIFNPRWLALLLAEISIGKKIRIGWNFYMKFRSQIENWVVTGSSLPFICYCDYFYSKNINYMLFFRYLWTRAVVVKLFIEHVCIEEAEIKRCRPLWVVSIYLESSFFLII